jgi:lipid-binding SYLF domain-containing protein
MTSNLDVRFENVTRTLWAMATAITLSMVPAAAYAAGAAEISRDAQAALQSLYAKVPTAKTIGAKAQAVLVFPKITKAGLGIGGQFGEGALIKGGKTVGYYNTAGVSSGLQAGAQQYGYAMFFMNDAALKQLDKTEGFEVGVGPSIVVMDEGKAKSTTTTSAKDDIYAFIFSQKGLMAGLGLQGNKITKIDPK